MLVLIIVFVFGVAFRDHRVETLLLLRGKDGSYPRSSLLPYRFVSWPNFAAQRTVLGASIIKHRANLLRLLVVQV